tara:strand:+ start:5416 stop:5586 length:171 start_codon:yes stop_codon:yes gene_type:complete
MDLKKQGEKQFKQSFRTLLFLLQLRSKLKAKKEKTAPSGLLAALVILIWGWGATKA